MTAAKVATLTDFLLARIGEDETLARAAIAWQDGDARPWVDNGGGLATDDGHGMAGYVGADVAPHIVRWAPARVLAECEAKRRIVEWDAARRDIDAGDARISFWGDGTVDVDDKRMNHEEFARRYMRPSPPSRHVQMLALPYADHPDYRDEWRP